MNKKFPNLLIIDGGSVKTNDEGIVKGLGIVFGSEDEPDQSSQRDFFTNDTFVTKRNSFTVPLYYDHGMGLIDTEVGEATLTKSETGWEADARIYVEDELGKKVYEAVKAKPHGFSTGALEHLVKREAKGNDTHFLKQWVVGELSLTERPAERKAVVQAVKSVDGDGNIELQDWQEVKPTEAPVIVSAKNDADEVVWQEGNELSFSKYIETLEAPLKSVELKYAGGYVTYNVFTEDEITGEGTEMTITEWPSADALLEHVANLISKAQFSIKTEETLEDKIKRIVDSAVSDGSELSELKAKLTEQETELADLRTQLSDREDALTKATEDLKAMNTRFDILAGAKDTLNKVKGNNNG